jgi:hypothetical protein
VHTPRFCGHDCMAGTLFRYDGTVRGLRISWLIVGMNGLALSTLMNFVREIQ